MKSLRIVLAALLLSSLGPVLAQPATRPAGVTTLPMTVKDVRSDSRTLVFYRHDNGGTPRPNDTIDARVLAPDAKLIVDGKAVALTSLRPGTSGTLTYSNATGFITGVEARSREALAKVERPAPEVRVIDYEPRAITAAKQQKAALELAQARARALEEAYAAYLAAQASAQRNPPRPSPGYTPYTPPSGSSRPSAGGGNSDTAMRAIFKILAAAIANKISKDQARGDGVFAGIFSGLASLGRDKLIESALKDVFPDVPASGIGAAQRVISLILDDQFTLDNLAKRTAIDTIKDKLHAEDPRLGATAELADFIYNLYEFRRR